MSLYDIFTDGFCIIKQDKKLKIVRNMGNLYKASIFTSVVEQHKASPVSAGSGN